MTKLECIWNIKNARQINKLEGLSSENYVITDGKARFVLKVCTNKQKYELDAINTISHFLYQKNFPAPLILPTQDGLHYFFDENRSYILYQMLEGHCLHEEDFEKSSLEEAAILLARLHQINVAELSFFNKQALPCVRQINENFHNLESALKENQLDAKSSEILTMSLLIKQSILSKAPLNEAHKQECFVHGDFHNENLLFNDRNHLTGLLDFEKCCLGNPYYDVIHFIRLACFNTGFQSENYEKSRIFSQKYLSIQAHSISQIAYGYMSYLLTQAQSLYLEKRYLKNKNPFICTIIERDNKVLKTFIDHADEIIERAFKYPLGRNHFLQLF